MKTHTKTTTAMLDDGAAREIPNEETRCAMALAESKELGVIEDDAMASDNADDAIAYLETLR